MRIDSPISCNAIITGSFTGSFIGDGTNLTGVTAEWDGSHTGNASITGDLTVGNLVTEGNVDGVDVSVLKTSVDTNTSAIAALDSTYATDADLTSVSGALAADVAVNTAKVGISSQQASDILDNNAKISFDTVSSDKLAGIEAGATGDQSAAEILAAIKTVDGAGSGLDADLLDGQSSAYYATAASVTANVSDIADNAAAIDVINAKDPVLTITGDASGTATFTNLGNASMTLTIADDSHSHTIANIDGLQTALNSKATPADVTTAVNNLIDGAGTAYNTLSELAAEIQANDGQIGTILSTQASLQSQINGKQAAGTYNTVIGTDTDINTAGATIIDNIYMTDGVITSHGARTLTLADLGYTGATNANYITNNNQLTNGAGYITSYTDTNTTYTAGSGLGLSGTVFSHSDTSSQGSVNNSGRTYIQDITLDGFGHVTGISSATETVVNTDTNTTYSAGNGLSLSGTQFLMSGAYTGNFSATGNITAYSDSRLKKDVKTIEGALAKTKDLRGVEFTRIDDDTKSIGVIAQELEAVLPELVLTDDEGMKSVNYAQITGLLIEAVKELSAKVDELSK